MIVEPTVYVIDDDQALREQLTFTIESVGLRVEAFASAEDFLASFDRKRPGCLVLDVRMPGMDGLELQDRLRAEESILPIILVTGHGDIPMTVRAMRAGAVDFLEKPFREQQLLECIRLAIERNRRSHCRQAERAAARNRVANLTDREREVMDLVVAGGQNKTIATELSLSHKTVECHRTKIMSKTQAKSVPDLIRLAHLAQG